MQITATTRDVGELSSACTIILLFERGRGAAFDAVNRESDGLVADAMRHAGFSAKMGKTLTVHAPHTRHKTVVLVGMGGKSEMHGNRLNRVAQTAAREISGMNPANVLYCLADISIRGSSHAQCVQRFAVALHQACYRYRATISEKSEKIKLARCVFQTAGELQDARHAIREADAIAAGMNLARELANLPPNICTPAYIAQQARKLARASAKLTVRVLKERDMERLGMGAFLSVSRGSRLPGHLVCLEYRGGRARQRPVALVGKGITFDTGGISIKPSATMDEMKFDMSGAASVLGAIATCLRLRLPINVVGVLACAENMPGGNASKPGDVVTTMSGQTVEILNTDAEGRLVLCDALSYVGRYKPDCVIDTATLTGACLVALGQEASGLLANDQALADELLKAGENSGDRSWQLPLWEEYQPQLDSNFADIANIGGRWAGTITAACFLSRFTKEYKWAHLDIAGVAWHTGRDKGSTGRPVPLLTEFLLNRARRAREE